MPALRDVIYLVRSQFGELVPQYLDDEYLVYWTNYALQDMCNAAQNLSTMVSVPFANGQQEAALPVYLDQITSVSYYSGQTFQLSAMRSDRLQTANRQLGIPCEFYIKTDTRTMSPQGTPSNPTGDIIPVDLTPNNPQGQDYVSIVGLWPIPNQSVNLRIMCTIYHPWVVAPLAPLGVPPNRLPGIIKYVCAKAWEKLGADDKAASYMADYNDMKQAFANYMIVQKQIRTPASYGGDGDRPSLQRGSSSVIFVDQSPSLYNQ